MTPPTNSAVGSTSKPGVAFGGANDRGFRVRPRRTARALAGSVLVAASIVAAVVILAERSDRVDVLAVAHDVGANEPIGPDGVRVVSIGSDDRIATIPASERNAIVVQFAVTNLQGGALLTRADIVPIRPLTRGMATVSVDVGPGQVPSTVGVGDHVVLVTQPRHDGRDGGPTALVDATVREIRGDLGALPTGGDGRVRVTLEVAPGNQAVIGTAASVSIAIPGHGVDVAEVAATQVSVPVPSSSAPVEAATSPAPTEGPSPLPPDVLSPTTTLAG